jgi:chitin disaccharide deacetylase
MKHLVVNADDFGACHGVNRGVIEAHRYGVVTSASLLVNWPGADEAASLARENPSLSVGLHASFVDQRRQAGLDVSDPVARRRVLEQQLRRFHDLLGREPTHLDSHHHVHVEEPLRADFRELSDGLDIPLRDCSGIPYCSRFYGQWDGESHPEQVSVAGLVSILQNDLREGVTELGCHPGRADRTLMSSYAAEREVELRTLCDPRVRHFLDRHGVGLIGFADVPALLSTA